MNRKKYPVTNIGTAFILVVFIILAMVTFATLSIVNTSNDSRFTEKVADRTAAFYQASNLAEERLADIDALLEGCYMADRADYYRKVQSVLSDAADLECDFSLPAPQVSYTVAMEQGWVLSVVLELPYPEESGASFYRILSWQELSTSDWEADDTLHVL